MNRVRHQAVGINIDTKGVFQLAQVRQVPLVVLISREYNLPVVASLDDMVRITWQNK